MFWITGTVLYTIMVANQTHIETDEAVKLAPQLELLLRLVGTAIAGLIGVYGFLFIGRVQTAMFSLPGAWVTGIAICFALSTVVSDYKSITIPHLITFVCIFLFTPTAFAILGTRRFFEISLFAFLTTLLASWFLFLFVPEFGMKMEVIDAAGSESVPRMSGTSHPNTLAGVSGFVVLIVSYMLSRNRISWKLAIPVLLLCIATFVLTQTRVAAFAAIVSLLFIYRRFWLRRDVFPLTFILVTVGLFAALFIAWGNNQGWLSGTALKSLTRSGEIEEITSFTGRNHVWSFVVQKIGESPLLGYGPGVAKTLLEKEGLLLHPHNVVLATALAGGVISGLFALIMFFQQLWISCRGTFKLAALITVYVFLNSLTETFIFDYIPGPSTVLFLVALYWPVLDDESF